MAGVVRVSLFEKGADPRDFALAPFGGTAGLHACAVANDLGMQKIIFPMHASTLSALGILNADLRYDLSKSQLLPANETSLGELKHAVSSLREQAITLLETARVQASARRVEFSCDVRYRGQAFELNTGWPELTGGADPDADSLSALVDHFHAQHEVLYAYSERKDPVEIVTVRALAIGELDKPDMQHMFKPPDHNRPLKRSIVIDGQQHELPVYQRQALQPGDRPHLGPLIIEEDYTVLMIESGWEISALEQGDLLCARVTKSDTSEALR